MQANVTKLFRYPVKGLSAEALDHVELRKGFGFPGDRVFAIALPTNDFNESSPVAKRKSDFIMLARFPQLTRLDVQFDQETHELSIAFGGKVISHSIDTNDGRKALANFFAQFLPEEMEGQKPRVVRAVGDHQFTDVGTHSFEMMHSVSLINLNSVRELEEKTGKKLDVRRFRPNIVVDFLPAWAEQSFVGKEITIGEVQFKGAWPTSRCAAPDANSETGERDINVVKTLKKAYGHHNIGVYLYIQSPGVIKIGDEVKVALEENFKPHQIYFASADEQGAENEKDDGIEKGRAARLIEEYGLSAYDAGILAGDEAAMKYFGSVVSSCNDPKTAVNWVSNDVMGRLKKDGLTFSLCPVAPARLGELCAMIIGNVISGKAAKEVFDIMWRNGGNPQEIVKEQGMEQVSDEGAIQNLCERLLLDNPENVCSYRAGKTTLLSWFVGQVMKETKGAANPAVVKNILTTMLKP